MLQITSRATAHRETLQQIYDEKLEHIKDVCAKVFSKYEKHLINSQDSLKLMEKQQQDWIDKLVSP